MCVLSMCVPLADFYYQIVHNMIENMMSEPSPQHQSQQDKSLISGQSSVVGTTLSSPRKSRKNLASRRDRFIIIIIITILLLIIMITIAAVISMIILIGRFIAPPPFLSWTTSTLADLLASQIFQVSSNRSF